MGWIHDDVDILFKNVFSVPAVPKVDSEHAEIYRIGIKKRTIIPSKGYPDHTIHCVHECFKDFNILMNTLIKYKTNLKTKSIIIHEAERLCLLETMIELDRIACEEYAQAIFNHELRIHL